MGLWGSQAGEGTVYVGQASLGDISKLWVQWEAEGNVQARVNIPNSKDRGCPWAQLDEGWTLRRPSKSVYPGSFRQAMQTCNTWAVLPQAQRNDSGYISTARSAPSLLAELPCVPETPCHQHHSVYKAFLYSWLLFCCTKNPQCITHSLLIDCQWQCKVRTLPARLWCEAQ